MIVFPNCKINLGLRILRKRTDGFHDIETLFYPLPVRDALEIIENPEFNFSQTGFHIEGDPENNLCIKAYQLIKKNFPELPAVIIHLHKVIPVGAGLGGGSADGAFALKLLNKKFDLKISTKKLMDYALQLGSDCPFFILNKPCFARGRGEILEPIKLDLSAYKIVIVNPGIHVSTKWAFSQITPALPEKSIKEIIPETIETWRENLNNDFEEPAFKKYPELKQIKNQLYHAGAVYAAMSGSGSTVFGIFKKEKPIDNSFPENYFYKELVCQPE